VSEVTTVPSHAGLHGVGERGQGRGRILSFVISFVISFYFLGRAWAEGKGVVANNASPQSHHEFSLGFGVLGQSIKLCPPPLRDADEGALVQKLRQVEDATEDDVGRGTKTGKGKNRCAGAILDFLRTTKVGARTFLFLSFSLFLYLWDRPGGGRGSRREPLADCSRSQRTANGKGLCTSITAYKRRSALMLGGWTLNTLPPIVQYR